MRAGYVPCYYVSGTNTVLVERKSEIVRLCSGIRGVLMSSRELIHSINNELTIVLGRAEMLSCAPVNEETQRACHEIKMAAGKLNQLLREYMRHSRVHNGN